MKNSTFQRIQKKQAGRLEIIRNYIFENWCVKDVERTIAAIKKHQGTIQKQIEFIKIDGKKNSNFKDFPWVADDRTGEQTYGYNSPEEIEGNLNYISDRFNCEFRLQWMLDVPENWRKLSKAIP